MTGNEVSRENINTAAIAQVGDLFAIQRLSDTARRLREIEALGPPTAADPVDADPDDWDAF